MFEHTRSRLTPVEQDGNRDGDRDGTTGAEPRAEPVRRAGPARATKPRPGGPEPASGPREGEIDLGELLRVFWRGKLLILVCAIVAMLLGGFYAFRVAQPRYAATTTLALQVRDQQVVDLESVISGVSTEQAAMNTEIEVIRSRGLLETLVEDLELTADPEFNAELRRVPAWSPAGLKALIRSYVGTPEQDAAALTAAPKEQMVLNATVDAVRDALSVTARRQTYLFSIQVRTTSPDKSARIVNRLAELYLEDQIAVKFQATEDAIAWLSGRVGDLEAELKEKEDAIKDLRSATSLISAEALEAQNRQAKEVRDRLMQTGADAEAARERVAQLEALRAAGDVAAMVDAVNDPTLARLAGRMDDDPDARALFDSRFELLLQRERSVVERAESQRAALQQSLDRLQAQIADQTADLTTLQQMTREAEATRVLYETFLTRLKETSVQIGLQQADSRILSAATPGRYVEPRKSMIMALSLVLGAMVGMAVLLARQFMHDGFRTAQDLEQFTGLTVLGQVPKIPIRKRKGLVEYFRDSPTSAAAEAIRNLRTSVLLSDVDNPPQIIMSTSTIPGEGKTTQAIALAQNLSGLGKKVLLVEGDIRRRTFTQYFKGKPGTGLVSVIAGEKTLEDSVTHDARLDVDVLMGEKTTINAADLFSSDKFRAFLDHARASYDYVIIDTPPVLVVPDARVIGGMVDAIIYTVRWDSTAKSQVRDGLRQLASVNLDVAGLVMSQIDPKGMRRYGYGGRHGAYAQYGSRYYDLK